MGCITETTSTGSVKCVLIFKRAELLYDIENACHIEGRVMPRETEPMLRHSIQGPGESGNIDVITRSLELSHRMLSEMLYTYTRSEVNSGELDDRLKEPGVYVIMLELPGDFSQSTLNLIEVLCHRYMVCKGIEEWLGLTSPARGAYWREKGAEAERELRKEMNHRVGRRRRKMNPF